MTLDEHLFMWFYVLIPLTVGGRLLEVGLLGQSTGKQCPGSPRMGGKLACSWQSRQRGFPAAVSQLHILLCVGACDLGRVFIHIDADGCGEVLFKFMKSLILSYLSLKFPFLTCK